MSIRNTCPPMEIETVTDTTVPNHDETEIESTEFEKNQKRYQDLISTFPHVKGWRFKDPFIRYGGQWWIQTILEGSLYAQEFFQARPRDFFICSYLKTGTTWLKSLTFIIANRSRFDDSTNPLLKRNPHELIPFFEIEFPLFPQVDSLKDKGKTLFSTHMHTSHYPIQL
uniref:Sulfotransferase n=1 Tax=Brassica oleracea var. oleracea TaxID=109376 RepID=A0A0D3CWR4_BRAOL